ncbi:MAG: MBL fold metallo-hydrolase [Deltaproteobacteria bacterium]|nr:MBL fold metallo-hydrolase [Deltaproteobacteria bacterium]
MNFETIEVGPLQVNCYILYDEEGNALVIDAGDNAEMILEKISALGLNLKMVISTHGHFDHVGANGLLKEKTGAKLLIHEADRELLKHAPRAAASFGLRAEEPPQADEYISHGQLIECGSIKIEVIHTPGHSPGGVSLLSDHTLFTGDTLFAGSIGRTDLPGGVHELLLKSVSEKLFSLADTVEIHPGHGPSSSIGHEKKYNPFFAAGSLYGS